MKSISYDIITIAVEQQDIQTLHRVRDRLIGDRTALVNKVHGLMHEYGIVIPKGVPKVRKVVVDKLESEKDKLTALSQKMTYRYYVCPLIPSPGDC